MDEAAVLVVVIAAMVVVALAVLARMVRVVPQRRVGLVERLGRFRRTIEPGLNLVAPFVDQVRTVDTGEQTVSLPSLSCVSSDHATVAVEVLLRFRVVDAVKAVYQIADYREGLAQLTAASLRNQLGRMTLEQARASHHELNNRRDLHDAVAGGARPWGIELLRVEIKAIEPTWR